jgi:translocator protein
MQDFTSYYESLKKPSWTPSTSLIGTMWTILYPIIFVTLFVIISKAYAKQISWAVAAPFIINILFNFAFTPVQFGLRNQFLALVVILCIWVTVIWSIVAAWSTVRLASCAYIPYLAWVSIASALQITIWWLNK